MLEYDLENIGLIRIIHDGSKKYSITSPSSFLQRLDYSFRNESLIKDFIGKNFLNANIKYFEDFLKEFPDVLSLEFIPEKLELYFLEMSEDFLSSIDHYDKKNALLKANKVQLEDINIEDDIREAYESICNSIETDLSEFKTKIIDLCLKCFIISQLGFSIELKRLKEIN